MANKRNYEWALASVIDGFFTQDKPGGVTQRVPFSLIVSSLQGADVFQPLGNDLTAIEAISGTGVLTRTGTNTWAVVSAVAPTDHASEHHYGGGDQITGSNIAGFRISDAPRWAGIGIVAPGTNADLDFRSVTAIRMMTMRWEAANDRLAIFSSNDDGSSRSDRILIPRASAAPVVINGGLNLASGGAQVSGIDAITSTREGRFTGMRLSNMSSGQIPVASDGNGQITASGQTDDGTYFTSGRTLRLWNTMARSGGTWTDLQWTPDAQERISMVSSNGSGVGAYHTFVVVPADSEATGRELGYYSWGQKLSGKSGSYPGLKASLGVTTKGAGGSTGGFGAQFHFDYRPDNGNILSTALRIGAFGGSTPDAVEAAILLRANAGAQIPAITSKLLKTSSDGTFQGATANTDYLPVNNPVSTGVSTANVTQHTARTYVGGARTIDPGLTPKFQRQTGAGTITLPTAIASYEGLEYKITFHGRFNVTFDTPSGEIYTLAAGASYWYDVASTTVSAGDASGENCACDVWCDGSNWYIRW